tara:strand:+ start:1817 stop:3142 length:1326 start_codon:yes stop_codon:yes gene_type:complete
MFYIVEAENKLDHLERLMKLGCFVDVISSNDLFHPKLTSTVAVYVRMLKSTHGYIIPIDHDEGLNVDKQRIYDMLSKCNKLYTVDKKKLLYHFNLQGAIDISLLYSMVNYDRLDISRNNSALNYFYNKFRQYSDINKLVPIAKHYEVCENIYKTIVPIIEYDLPSGFDFYNKTATNVFFLLEQHGIGVHYEPFVEMFSPRDPLYNIKDNTVLTSYNLYNATSRPTNSFNSINFAAIPHSEKHRETFRPQNDCFIEFDFDGYHLRLLCDQINYQLTDESAHKQLAKHYFGTEDITDKQYKEAKQINFQAIYGKIPEEHKNLEIFKLIQEYIDNMWSVFKEAGIVCNPQSGKPFTSRLKETHPAKLMNYMMQSLETSNNILILKEVLRYLRDKKTKISLYTYDAILFDFSKEDGKETLKGIQQILESKGKFPVKFKYSNNLVL